MIKDLFGILLIECEYDKNCDIGEYVDYENCKCRKKLVEQITDECTETIEEVKLVEITLENEKNYKYSSCTLYIVLIIVFFKIFIGITIYFVYYNWSLMKNNVSCITFDTRKRNKNLMNAIPLNEHINGRNKTNRY